VAAVTDSCVSCGLSFSPGDRRLEVVWDGKLWKPREAPVTGLFCLLDALSRCEKLNAGELPLVTEETRLVPVRGLVVEGEWVSLEELENLAEQGPLDSAFGAGSFHVSTSAVGRALTAAGLATRETRGGYHGTPVLARLLDNLHESEDNGTGESTGTGVRE
jgi:hypothetical protein